MATTLAFRTVLSTVESNEDYYYSMDDDDNNNNNDTDMMLFTSSSNENSSNSSSTAKNAASTAQPPSHDSFDCCWRAASAASRSNSSNNRDCSTNFGAEDDASSDDGWDQQHANDDALLEEDNKDDETDATAAAVQSDQHDSAAAAVIFRRGAQPPASSSGSSSMMEDDPAEEEQDTCTTTSESATEQRSNIPGGLSNLGNTCYMASALQMVASLDNGGTSGGLLARLAAREPARPSELRGRLLEVLRRLAAGAAVRPSALKDAVDDRSPLFLGCRQQDAHEFLTTLLDLLDEDYKQQPPPPSQEEENKQEEETVAAECVEKEPEEQRDDAAAEGEDLESATQEEPATMMMEVERSDDHHIPSKKARTEDHDGSCGTCIMDTENEEEPSSCEHSAALEGLLQLAGPLDDSCRQNHQTSFSELDVEAISRLLHGNSDDTLLVLQPPDGSSTVSSTAPVTVSPYKLVGGRMNTADVVLTPYGNDSDCRHHSETLQQQQQSPHPSHLAATTSSCSNSNAASDDDNDNTQEEPDKVQSPIDECFTTQVRVRLTCDSCKYSRCHKETYLHLSLEIGENTATTIEDGLRKFFGSCRQEVKCEKCFGETATQTTEIVSLPPAMLLHLKRFIVDVSPDYTEISYRKNRSTVLYEPELAIAAEEGGVLSEFLAPDCLLPDTPPRNDATASSSPSGPKYKLVSVCNHIGSSASCGHYTADALKTTEDGGDQWFRLNDSFVSRISAAEAIEQSRETAYMVLYTLQ